MNECLILVDLQNDYFPGGRMELVGIQAAAEKAQTLLNDFRRSKSPIIHIQHISTRPGATFFFPETDGVKINQMVAPPRERNHCRKKLSQQLPRHFSGENPEERKNHQPGYLRRHESHVYRRNYPGGFRLGFQLRCRRRGLRNKGLEF